MESKPQQKNTGIATEFTAQQIIDIAKKYDGDFIEPIHTEMRDLKTNNKSAKFAVAWTPVKIKDLDGNLRDPFFKFTKQILGGKAKLPPGSDSPKYMSIPIRYMEKEEIEGGDYVAKNPDDPTEVKKINDKIQTYYDVNLLAVKALDLLESALRKASEKMLEKEKNRELKANFNKSSRTTDQLNFLSFKQTSYKSVEDNIETHNEMEHPIYRLRLPIYDYNNDGRIGIGFRSKKSPETRIFKPIVFDVRKMTKKNGYKEVPASVVITEVNGNQKRAFINYETAPTFITMKSICNISFRINNITSSKAGISFDVSISKMYIHRHKAVISTNRTDTVGIAELKDSLGTADDEEDTEDAIHGNDTNEGEDSPIEEKKATRPKRNASREVLTKVVTNRTTNLPNDDLDVDMPVSDDELSG